MRRGDEIPYPGFMHPLNEGTLLEEIEGIRRTSVMNDGQSDSEFEYLFSYMNPTATPITTSRSVQFRQLYQEVDSEYYKQEGIFIKIRPGEDRREVVKDTTIYPFSSHGRLVMIFNGRAVYGSGTLINSRFVLTAAHNLYPRYFNKEPDSILFIPALNGTKCPYGIIGVRRYFYPEEFKRTRLEDYAVLELEEDVGESTGYIQMRMHRPEIDGIECSLYGYPGYANREENNHQYGMNGIVALIPRENLIIYDIDTEPGMSGSGVYYKSQEDNKYFTIGVHIKGYMNQSYNAGTFLTNERVENIEEWIKSNTIPTKHNLLMLTSEVYGRDSEINTLRASMKNKIRLGVIGLCGIAGVGKSTIALKYATKCIGGYDYIWWINSETQATFRGDVLSLAKELKIEGKTYQEILNKLIPMLNSRDIKFLLILDNLQDEDMAKELLATKGHYIITTRLGHLNCEKIDVGTLSREASIQLLSSRLPDKHKTELDYLANLLEDLPLALLQAAAYIRELQIDVGDYVSQFSGIVTIDDKIKNIVSQNIDFLGEESRHILKIVCLGFCDNIPYDMLYTVYCSKYPNTDEFDFNYHLGNIVKFSILSYDTKKDLLKIHRVLHEASIAKLSECISHQLIDHFSDYQYNNYMSGGYIYISEDVNRKKYLTLHVETFLNKYKSTKLSYRDLVLYLGVALNYWQILKDHRTPNKYIHLIEESLKHQIYPDVELEQIYLIVAELYHSMGEYTRTQQYLLKSKTVMSPVNLYNLLHHSIVFKIHGRFYISIGQFDKAFELLDICMSSQESVLPDNHPYLSDTYCDIASLCTMAGYYKQAEEYYIKALRIYESIYPERHPYIVRIYNDLGVIYHYERKYEKSMEYCIKAIKIQEAVLPNNHPNLAKCYNNLGGLYSSLKEYKKAEEYFTKTLAIQEAILPYNSPDLATSYNNLQAIHSYMGEYKKAAEYNIKALSILEAVLPSNHPELALCYNNTGYLYYNIEDYELAQEYYIKALSIIDVALIDDRNKSLIYSNIGSLYITLGMKTEAEEYILKSIAIEEKLLPSDNPNIGQSYHDLAGLYMHLGNIQKAEEYLTKYLQISEANLPSNHPELASIYSNLEKINELKRRRSYCECF